MQYKAPSVIELLLNAQEATSWCVLFTKLLKRIESKDEILRKSFILTMRLSHLRIASNIDLDQVALTRTLNVDTFFHSAKEIIH